MDNIGIKFYIISTQKKKKNWYFVITLVLKLEFNFFFLIVDVGALVGKMERGKVSYIWYAWIDLHIPEITPCQLIEPALWLLNMLTRNRDFLLMGFRDGTIWCTFGQGNLSNIANVASVRHYCNVILNRPDPMIILSLSSYDCGFSNKHKHKEPWEKKQGHIA